MTSRVIAVGVLFFSVSTGRYLYLMRTDPRHPDCWGLPGGRVEAGESLLAALERECQEEMGAMPEFVRLVPIERFTSVDGHFQYNTFWCAVENEFPVVLNHEHNGYAWVASGTYPRPLHSGLFSTVNFEAVQDKLAVIEAGLSGD